MKWRTSIVPVVLVSVVVAGTAIATGPTAHAAAPSTTYTLDEDFAGGTANNVVNSTPGQLQLDDTITAFPFVWVALSERGTIAKIVTTTGEVLGEYSTTSDGDSSNNPSRTTVGNDGSVWAGNRNQSSVIHVGLLEGGQCVDRNGNGTIETSTGYGDVLLWPGGSSGASSPVTEAADECILHYVDTAGSDTRHVSVDPEGNIWIGSLSRDFQKIDSSTGTIVPGTARVLPCGGYGGLVDGNGVLWSATSGSQFLRWDPNVPDEVGVNPRCLSVTNYGVARDSQNNIWVSQLSGGFVSKISPDGNTIESFATGISSTQGLAVDGNDDVWLSSSLFGGANKIVHMKNDGTIVGTVEGAGSGSTGVSVDAAGKIWTANIDSSDATRIDPTLGAIGGDGVTPIGAFDLTVPLPGASPYNYSDMTGSALTGRPDLGTWTVVYDGGTADATWEKISWNADVTGDGSLQVSVASSADGVSFGPAVTTTNGAALLIPDGRYVRVTVAFGRASSGASPILYDLTINTPPPATSTTVPPTTAPPTTAPPTTAPPTTAPPTTIDTGAGAGAPSTLEPVGFLPPTGSSGSTGLVAVLLIAMGAGAVLVARPPRRRPL